MNGFVKKDEMRPLYRQVMQKLSASIAAGEYGVGEKLPNENDLCAVFDVSRITLRRAVEELVKKGVLEKRQGKGTFVASSDSMISFRKVSSFHETCKRQGRKPSTRLIHVRQIPADEQDAKDLNLAPGQRIFEILRVRWADDEPVMLEYNHFSSAYAYLAECDLEGSLYNLLREFGVEPGDAVHDISIRPASDEAARRLEVPKGTPLLFLREMIYDQKGRPLHNSQQWIRGDRFTFRI